MRIASLARCCSAVLHHPATAFNSARPLRLRTALGVLLLRTSNFSGAHALRNGKDPMSRNSFLSFALSMIVVAVGLAASFMPAASASVPLTRARQTEVRIGDDLWSPWWAIYETRPRLVSTGACHEESASGLRQSQRRQSYSYWHHPRPS